MSETIVIEERFRGPPNSGNGGYVAGAFAELLDMPGEDVEITLRSPIPLDKPMQVIRVDARVTVMDGETLIAEAKTAEIDLKVPALPDWQRVRDAAPASYSLGEKSNPMLPGSRGFHPVCFCCGADHEDGLEIFAAPVPGTDQVATVWNTRSRWADADGRLPAAFLWTALDCPGQFAWLAAGTRTGMLGRITARVLARPVAGEPLLVTAWPVNVEGRKHFAGSAVHDDSGRLLARALSVWIGRRD